MLTKSIVMIQWTKKWPSLLRRTYVCIYKMYRALYCNDMYVGCKGKRRRGCKASSRIGYLNRSFEEERTCLRHVTLQSVSSPMNMFLVESRLSLSFFLSLSLFSFSCHPSCCPPQGSPFNFWRRQVRCTSGTGFSTPLFKHRHRALGDLLGHVVPGSCITSPLAWLSLFILIGVSEVFVLQVGKVWFTRILFPFLLLYSLSFSLSLLVCKSKKKMLNAKDQWYHFFGVLPWALIRIVGVQKMHDSVPELFSRPCMS